MDPIISLGGMALVVGGLIGQGFEMKRIRATVRTDEMLSSKKIFADKRNLKWYAMIAAGFAVWFIGRA